MPDEEVFLLDQSRKLYEAWTLFCKQLPAEQQKGILTELPSIEHLYQSVSDASATWEENRSSGTGKIKKTFARVCEVLNTHSNLVSIFPTDDKYVRLVTGSISAIARVSPITKVQWYCGEIEQRQGLDQSHEASLWCCRQPRGIEPRYDLLERPHRRIWKRADDAAIHHRAVRCCSRVPH